ncbi:MAG: hypothetical protein KKC46_04760 [Proteobacteria bacterium]|nr:hypothetical protein [Pseudomonadota bacterium]
MVLLSKLKILFCLIFFVFFVFEGQAKSAPVWVDGKSMSITHNYDGSMQIQGSHAVIAELSSSGSILFSGYMEFDLDDIPSIPNLGYTLHLMDTGGRTIGNSTTTISYYNGDGVITLDDYSGATLGVLTQLTRPYLGGPTYLDVTDLVKYFLDNGYDYLGLKFIPVTGGDAFGFVEYGVYPEWRSGLMYDISSVPIPGAFWLFGSGLIGLLNLRRIFSNNR